MYFFFSSRRRQTRCALVTGVQTCALPIYFNALPEELQEMILASPTATEQMVRFFAAGGQIEILPNIVGAFEGQYQPGEPPVIVLDQGTIQAAMDGDNDAYENGILISVEIGRAHV